MRTRVQKQQLGGARHAHSRNPLPDSSPSSNEPINTQVISDYLRWRVVDVSTKLLSHQPLEPSRALANRMYNERTLLQAVVSQAPVANPPPPAGTPIAAPEKRKGGTGNTSATLPSPRQPLSVTYAEGSLCRQWTQSRLLPFGLEALNAFQLPAIALAMSPSTEDMLATVVAFLYRQGRASASERKAVAPPVGPLFYDSAEELDVTVAVPFLLALTEQELRGVAPGFTTRVTLTCSLIALRVLKLAMQRERAPPAEDSSSRANSQHRTGTCPTASLFRVPTLSAKVARVSSASETHQLGHTLCKCINRGLVSNRRKGSRSARSSLSSSMRVLAADSSRHSQSCGSPVRGECEGDGAKDDDVAPLSVVDLDGLVDPLFLPPDEASAVSRTPTVSEKVFRKALFALTTALWSVYEVAIPLAALLSSRTGSNPTDTTPTKLDFAPLLSALSRSLKDNTLDVMAGHEGVGFAEAMVADDFANVLRPIASQYTSGSSTSGANSGNGAALLPPLYLVPTDLSSFQKGLVTRGQGCNPAIAAVWVQSFDWVLQVTESVLVEEYVKQSL